ncbi:lysoplasmalogenase [Legionella israelensis]|uniref:Lysoplasmalogenase n=1 Tax=Legionella israelensis TaxID=454 RepID=A0AAX1ED46_9GAMM|nr:lysoplasmalogenase [Legionella israelensis]QBR83043.1 lysoplasmalogenase [Legionella israelensis]
MNKDILERTYKAFFFTSILYLFIGLHIHFPIASLLKPLPIFCLMFLAEHSSLSLSKRKLIWLGLLFSASGDIVLSLKAQNTLEFGLFCFLLAHITYIILFNRFLSQWYLRKDFFFIFILTVFLVSGLVFFILSPYFGQMKIPVALYMLVINLMAISALRHNPISASGAILFMFSDALIAFNEFMFKNHEYSFWIMLSYYLAQFFLITGFIKNQQDKKSASIAINSACNKPH